MKKIITLSINILFLASIADAQQPANPGFETWSVQTFYDEPTPYMSSNQWTFSFLPMGNVIKSTGSFHSTYAAQLTTVSSGTDTIMGGLFIGIPGQGGVKGGIPYTGQPDSITSYVRYNILTNDTAYMIVGFKKSGAIMTIASKYFVGTQSAYKRFSMPSNLPVSPAPDSIIVIITSSSLDGVKMPGSTLVIDSITFKGTNQGFPNPSFETWVTKTSEEPDNWTTINFAATTTLSATKSTSSHSGTYAIRIETIEAFGGDTLGLVTNGYFGNDGPEGGMKVNANPSKITGWYKYTAVGLDTAIAAAETFNNGVRLDSSLKKLPPTNTYTYFELPFTYNNFPYTDTLNIVFGSGNFADSTSYFGSGSVLYVDDIAVVYLPVGTADEPTIKSNSVFPNPFSDLAIFRFDNPNGLTHELLIYDILGNHVMKKENITTGSIVIQRNQLPAGIYQYSIVEKHSGKISASGKLVID
ncbi:MAG: T9SS type A sorting domain-containing protein [Bacteroidetes bacterium]|nr:MAG: T9SS type A sorting domain-containing protein [Bacteroidota bacterium]